MLSYLLNSRGSSCRVSYLSNHVGGTRLKGWALVEMNCMVRNIRE